MKGPANFKTQSQALCDNARAMDAVKEDLHSPCQSIAASHNGTDKEHIPVTSCQGLQNRNSGEKLTNLTSSRTSYFVHRKSV